MVKCDTPARWFVKLTKAQALKLDRIAQILGERPVRKVIYIRDKLVNIVI